MLPYLLVFVIAIAYYLFAGKNKAHSEVLLGLYFLYIALFIGLGDMIGGYDRYIYGEVFDGIADVTRSDKDYHKLYYLVNGHEFGYFYWQVLVSYFTENRYIFILITTLFAYFLYFNAFKKYIYDYPLATIVFLGIFYYFTMTYLRQVIACGICWQAYRYIWERKPIHFFSLVLIAWLFHAGTIVFAVIYFLPIKKFSKSKIVLGLILCFIVGLTPLPTQLMAASSDRTAGYADEEQGFRIEYVLEVVFFVWVFFQNYRYIPNDKKTIIMLNSCFIFCAILLLFMRFGQGGRIGWPFFFGLIYMLTVLSDRPKAFVWMKPLVISVCFVLFMRITIGWQALNVPYHTFFVNGVPCGYMYKSHEYDFNYHINKLYRKAWDPVF